MIKIIDFAAGDLVSKVGQILLFENVKTNCIIDLVDTDLVLADLFQHGILVFTHSGNGVHGRFWITIYYIHRISYSSLVNT
jgi:hypothetical protein